jgi:hypothetical protein
MICPNSDADVVKEVCPSLPEWANYLLEPYADIESKDDSKQNSDNNQRGPMLSYKITDDIIKWRGETVTETTQTETSSSVITEEWWKKNFTYITNAALILAIADALQVGYSRYEKLKKLNRSQQ